MANIIRFGNNRGGGNRTYLYNLGDECINLTNGWVSETNGIGGTTYIPITKNVNNMEANISSAKASNPITNNKIDLTNVHNIFIDCELISETGTGGKLFFLEVKDLKNQDLTPYVKQYAINTELVARSIYALNVSDLVGSYYIRVVNYAGTGYAINTKIHKIWLE